MKGLDVLDICYGCKHGPVDVKQKPCLIVVTRIHVDAIKTA